ncbi:NAD(P)-binding protein, partial [Coemansia reversa NRRL 1564]
DYSVKLKNKVAIVTGAASGFGKLLSERLVEYNANVLLVDINPSIEQQSKLLNKEKPGSTHWEVCDLCQTHLIQGLFDNAIKHFGKVDFVVNNAGIANDCSLFSQPDYRELDKIVRLNLQAPMEATRVAVRYFKKSKREGVVVNTASIGGLLPVSIMESYGTTKAGLIFFTTTCRNLAPQIRVNAIAP